LVTGGSRGIGRAIAEAFLAEGAKVVITGTNEQKGATALKEIDRSGEVHFVRADAKVREDCERAVDETISQFGKIDILVNNAGGATGHAPVVDLTDEAFEDALKWNLWSTFWCSRRALRSMIDQGFGRIINISSVEGKVGKPGLGIYVTAKHAINGLTKTMAQETGTLGITVNALCPGVIETDIVRTEGPAAAAAMGLTYEQLIDRFAQESATKRIMEVEDVANVAVLLASDIGAGITGSLISIDGGTSPY
jgi:NAD(P)-dependent dehydrogenase (short-subunit alcohol dehydrogenase family)